MRDFRAWLRYLLGRFRYHYEDKRLWINKDVSVAYGSVTSYEHGYTEGDVICSKGGDIVHPVNGVNSNENENDALSNDVVGGLTSVADAALINLLAELMDDSNSQSTSYDEALEGIHGSPVIFGCEHASYSPSQSPSKRKNKMSSPSAKVKKNRST